MLRTARSRDEPPAARRRAIASALIGAALCLAMGARGAGADGMEGGNGLSRGAAESLIYEYLAQDLPRFVGMRQRTAYLAELEASPPRFDEHDRYHFNPPGGILEFEYDAEHRALIVRAAIHRYKGRQQGHGLSFQQIAEAVQRHATASRVSLGGGRLDTAPELDGVFLRRDFVSPPRSTRWLAQQIDDLVDAAMRWFREDYLDALRAYAATLAPPASASGRSGRFRTAMALTDDPELYARLWSRPPGAVKPWHVSVHEARPGSELMLAIHVVDPTADAAGNARVEATTRLVGPDGVERGTPTLAVLWNEPPPPTGHFQLTRWPIKVGFAAGEPAGTFQVLAEVCDRVAGSCVQLTHPVRLVRDP